MSEGAISTPRHGRSDQVYPPQMGMGTMPMLLYPGTSSAQHYPNMSQYQYDNLRIPPGLDNNYMPMSPHYEVLPSNSSRTMDFGVRTVFIYPFYLFLTHHYRYVHRWILIRREHSGTANPGFRTRGSKPLPRFLSYPGGHQHRQCRPPRPDDLGYNCNSCHTDHTLLHTQRQRDNT